MKEYETLLDKAYINYLTSSHLYTLSLDDDAYINIIAYHLQQALELAIKFVLEQNGVEYPRTHDIEQLVLIANKENVDLKLTEYIDDHQETFSSWEAKTRYVLNYYVDIKKIEKSLPEVKSYLDTIKNEYKDVGVVQE